ncbi:helix-turn-helix transcriptional regulator [Actinacidiphila sp. bgisy167]|uniref:helix-turn-helix transcriptional regulator n=1 Tax=Actinacidiphila sp. bgisy167 TaxID=3413797 RepID=UPI003D72C53A
MPETSARLLRLLSLLQSRRDWTGPELAERLDVTARTVRRDVERLRALGYPVHATPGPAGGYRLGAGAALPPLLLDDEEAIAVALCLRTGAGGSVEGIEETSLRALAKLEQVLPARLRRRAQAMEAVAVSRPAGLSGRRRPGSADRDRRRLPRPRTAALDYRAHGGAVGRRTVEPHSLVHHGRRWYLLAWDTDRQDWRTFRVDRMDLKSPTGPRFTPRRPPADAASYVAHGVTSRAYRHQAVVVVHAPAEAVAEYAAYATVESTGPDSCVLRAGSESLDALAVSIGMLGVDCEVREPLEPAERLRAVADRLARAAGAPRGDAAGAPPGP